MWYRSWFDSPYYHLLYQHRDVQEAKQFIDVLTDFLLSEGHVKIGDSWLDTACGTGRHAIYLAQKGFQVTGIDLSPNNIEQAIKQSRNLSNIQFFVQDIRQLLPTVFEVVSNLFTSFGYFDNDEENVQVVKNWVKQSNNIIILDYFNSEYVMQTLIPHEKVVKKSITFYITRRIEDNTVIKTITFADQGRNYLFEERVKLYSSKTLIHFFQQAGASILAQWGDYQAHSQGKRCILIAKKIKN
ncbi:MAG: class I SAM-dependent methyltransferase [Bacteroidia bacterium]|nr:class I SAM-dependent methyltransferase [Bacteroidia bacterium]MDW8302696.1 class I SAM-dependent methyltransferase [Bacteroidia bacterium]